jgi:hypothetical protein
MLVDEASGLGAPERDVFTHAQLVDAVRVERRARAVAVDAAALELAEMGEQVGESDVGARREATRRRVELWVGQGFE